MLLRNIDNNDMPVELNRSPYNWPIGLTGATSLKAENIVVIKSGVRVTFEASNEMQAQIIGQHD